MEEDPQRSTLHTWNLNNLLETREGIRNGFNVLLSTDQQWTGSSGTLAINKAERGTSDDCTITEESRARSTIV